MDYAEFQRRWQSFARRPFSIVVLSVVLVATSAVSADETIIVTDVSGTRNSCTLKSWSADKLIVESPTPQEILFADVRSLTFEHPSQNVAIGAPMIWMSNGDRVSARAVNAADDLLGISWPAMGAKDPPKLPLEKVAAIIFELPATKSEQLRLFADLETFSPGSDLVMLTNGDRSLGEFQRLDASFVELKVARNTLKLDRSRVRAIRFNPELTNATRTLGSRALLTLTDGSRLTSTRTELTDDEIHLKSSGLGSLVLPLAAIRSVQIFGGRVIPIADYEPAKIEFTPYLSTKWPLVPNENVLHGPLMLRGIEYTTGLGTHSRMSVTYDLRGDEREFQSAVGIDDAANGAGSVVFGVDLDGRRVWTSPEITGKSPATIVPEIRLQGSKRMTLLVEFGQFADVSDYADWCDTVLILDRAR